MINLVMFLYKMLNFDYGVIEVWDWFVMIMDFFVVDIIDLL